MDGICAFRYQKSGRARAEPYRENNKKGESTTSSFEPIIDLSYLFLKRNNGKEMQDQKLNFRKSLVEFLKKLGVFLTFNTN